MGLTLIGSVALVTLAGCGRGVMNYMGGEREAWRAEAEAECMKSGAVKETATVVRVEPIDGPGMCGATFPLKVAALGEGPIAGYADDIRPPGSIPGGPDRWPITQQPPRYTPPSPAAPRPPMEPGTYQPRGAPMAITPDVQSQPRAYEPVATRPAYDPRDATVQPLRVPDAPRASQPQVSSQPQYQPPRAPQYAPPQQQEESGDYDDIPDDAVLPDRSKVQRQSVFKPTYQPPYYQTPKLGPMGNPNVMAGMKAAVTPTATLACPMVSALDQWVTDAVQPAALKWFHQPVVEIKQISAYACRGMVGNATAHISEHAFGNALDVAGFVLADGRKVLVKSGWNGSPEETGFLHDVQLAACERFTTVLAPGYNVYHYDHIHLDLMRRSSGRKACKPYAMTGEEAAAKLSRSKYAQKNGGVTGSSPKWTEKERATPGEDGEFDGPTGSIGATSAIKPKPVKTLTIKAQPAIAGEDGDFDE